MVVAEGPRSGSERPDPTSTCHHTTVAQRHQRSHATATAGPHQPHTLTVTRTHSQ